MAGTKGFRGSVAAALAHVSALPNGSDLSLVLKTIQSEIDGLTLEVSGDLHRVDMILKNGKRAGVRVTSARQLRPGSTPMLRFKPPQNSREFEVIYFGGVDNKGKAVVHKLTPNDIGGRKTLTLRCGAI